MTLARSLLALTLVGCAYDGEPPPQEWVDHPLTAEVVSVLPPSECTPAEVWVAYTDSQDDFDRRGLDPDQTLDCQLLPQRRYRGTRHTALVWTAEHVSPRHCWTHEVAHYLLGCADAPLDRGHTGEVWDVIGRDER